MNYLFDNPLYAYEDYWYQQYIDDLHDAWWADTQPEGGFDYQDWECPWQ